MSDDGSADLLRELASHLEPVFENLDGGVYLCLDARHEVCNERLTRMYGRSVEEWCAVEDFQETFVADPDRAAYCDFYGRTVRQFDRPSPFALSAGLIALDRREQQFAAPKRVPTVVVAVGAAGL